MTWIIVRTQHRKEASVASLISSLARCATWHPVQIVPCRPAISRRVTAKAHLRPFREIAILPRRVFACLDWHAAPSLMGIHGVTEIERDGEERVITIPDGQLAAFRAALDAENRAAMALVAVSTKRQKQRWQSLHDALLTLITGTEQEQAA